MQRQARWRALAVTYAIVAGMQVYLAISMNAAWTWVLGDVFAVAAAGFGFAAQRGGQPPVDGALRQPDLPGKALTSETRNAVYLQSDLRSTH
jgi:hypothetical protein